MDFSTSPLPAAVIATRLGLTGLATSAITGTLTLTKTGTTARTATFPDAAIGVQSETEERSADFTARVHGQYVSTATLTVTDPTPAQGHEFVVHVRNGTSTVGGTAYAAGQTVWRSYHSGAWSNTVIASLSTGQSFTALQTFTAGLTVSAGTTALQDVTCTTLTASGSGAIGATALLGSERLRIAGGTMGTPGATDVLVAAGKVYCGDTSAASIQTAGGITCTTLMASGNIVDDVSIAGILEVRARNLSNGAASYAQLVAQNDGTRRAYFGVVGTGTTALGGANTIYIGGNSTVYHIASDLVVGAWSTAGLAVGASALLASERLRVAGGTMGTPGATDVLLAAGKVYAGDTSATSIQTAGGITAANNSSISYSANAPGNLLSLRNSSAGSAAFAQLQIGNDTSAAAGYFFAVSSTYSGAYAAGSMNFGANGAMSILSNNIVRITSTGSSLANGTVAVLNTTASTSTAIGALTVAGGVGVAGRVSATEFASGTTKVLGAQGAAVADATDAASAITQLNALLGRCRAHGLIA